MHKYKLLSKKGDFLRPHVAVLLGYIRSKGLRTMAQFNAAIKFLKGGGGDGPELKEAAGIEKGAARPGSQTAGTVSLKDIYEIALVKQRDHALAHLPLRSICKMLVGSARSTLLRFDKAVRGMG